MDRIERLTQTVEPLLSWYDRNARRLPWRSDPTPYHVWLSEIMLQQTRVGAAIDYYTRFLDALPDIASLAEVEEERLMKLWQGLGYYSRAKNLRKAAIRIMEDFDGSFPSDPGLIASLPGIGDYTAGAIASIAFSLPVPAVDGNVLRVLSRLLLDRRDVLKPQVKRDYREALSLILPRKRPGDYNQALMDLGEGPCRPNGAPDCGACPLHDLCLAGEAGEAEALPVRSPKKQRRIEERSVFLIRREDRIALHKREASGLLSGLWELPNALKKAPDPLGSWGFPVSRYQKLGTGKHVFTHIEWHMELFRVQVLSDFLPEEGTWVWADREELASFYSLPSAFRVFEADFFR